MTVIRSPRALMAGIPSLSEYSNLYIASLKVGISGMLQFSSPLIVTIVVSVRWGVPSS
jgi:hypothetical protein